MAHADISFFAVFFFMVCFTVRNTVYTLSHERWFAEDPCQNYAGCNRALNEKGEKKRHEYTSVNSGKSQITLLFSSLSFDRVVPLLDTWRHHCFAWITNSSSTIELRRASRYDGCRHIWTQNQSSSFAKLQATKKPIRSTCAPTGKNNGATHESRSLPIRHWLLRPSEQTNWHTS